MNGVSGQSVSGKRWSIFPLRTPLPGIVEGRDKYEVENKGDAQWVIHGSSRLCPEILGLCPEILGLCLYLQFSGGGKGVGVYYGQTVRVTGSLDLSGTVL